MSYRTPKVFTRVGRPIMRHGYKIEVMNNHWYSFRYEWKITAPKNRPRKIPRVTFDPISHRSAASALDYARTAIAEMRSPFWIFNMNVEDGWPVRS